MTQTIFQPDSNSTLGVYATIRLALIDFVHPVTGFRITDSVPENRIMIRQAPTPVKYPYICMLLTDRVTGGAYNGYRATMNLQLQIIGRQEGQFETVENVADLVDQALLGYVQSKSGLTFGRSISRSSLPPFTEPADKEVVGVVMMAPMVLWPKFLTNLRPDPQ